MQPWQAALANSQISRGILRFRCDASATHMQINQGVINEKGRLSRIELDRMMQKQKDSVLKASPTGQV